MTTCSGGFNVSPRVMLALTFLLIASGCKDSDVPPRPDSGVFISEDGGLPPLPAGSRQMRITITNNSGMKQRVRFTGSAWPTAVRPDWAHHTLPVVTSLAPGEKRTYVLTGSVGDFFHYAVENWTSDRDAKFGVGDIFEITDAVMTIDCALEIRNTSGRRDLSATCTQPPLKGDDPRGG